MSQQRRSALARQVRGKPPAKKNRSHLWFTILGAVVVFSLIATLVGPPLVDYLTKPSDSASDLDYQGPSDDPNETDYRAEVAAHPNDPEALAALAGYLGQTGRVDEAIPLFEKALAIAPEDWGIRLDFADVLAIGDKRADAEIQYKKVIAAQPANVIAIYSLGRLYASWVPARTSEAIAQYQQVVAIGEGTYVRELALQALAQLGIASPVAGSPVASPIAGGGSS